MSHKKFAGYPMRAGITIVKNGGQLWHLLKIEDNKKFHLFRVVANNDGSFTGVNPNEVKVPDRPFKDEE